MASAAKKKPTREQIPRGANLCEYCAAKCCRYFALPIETPKTRKDYEFIRWFLLHDRAAVFTEDGDWYLLVYTACKHLRADQRCAIYDQRPLVCRNYSTRKCEYEDDWTYERYFETPEQVEEYAEAVLLPKPGANIRSRRTPAAPASVER